MVPTPKLKEALKLIKECIHPNIVQIRNPRSDHYVKIDRAAGRIVSSKVSPGPYKNIFIIGEQKNG